jgi:hypothetical protein
MPTDWIKLADSSLEVLVALYVTYNLLIDSKNYLSLTSVLVCDESDRRFLALLELNHLQLNHPDTLSIQLSLTDMVLDLFDKLSLERFIFAIDRVRLTRKANLLADAVQYCNTQIMRLQDMVTITDY